MSVSYVNRGSSASGTTPLSVPHHATTVTAGNLLVMFVAHKYPAQDVSTPSGWTAPANNTWSGGAGASGVDTGQVEVTAFYKVAAGTEAGTSESVTITGVNSAVAFIAQFSRSGGSSWGVTATGGAQNTGGSTAVSVTGGANLSLANGDMVAFAWGANNNLYTHATPTLTATGATITAPTEQGEQSSAIGDDMALVIATAPVTAGPSSAAPVGGMTASGAAGNAPAGAMVFVRLYEASAASSLTDVDTDETITTGQTGIAYTGTGLTNADEMRVYTGTEYAAGSAFVATNATSGTFTAPTLSAVLAAGVKFGTVTFDIRDGGVSLGTLAGTLNIESGWTVHDVTDTAGATDEGCIYYGASPAVAVGDQFIFENAGGSVTINSTGFLTFGDGVTETNYYAWDDTDNTWSGPWNLSVATAVTGSGIVFIRRRRR